MKTIRDPAALGLVYERYRSLPKSRFREILEPHLSKAEIDQFFTSRSIIIRYLDNIISGSAMRHRTDLQTAA
jgi:hypothetical protein